LTEVDRCTLRLAFVGRHLAERCQQRGNRTLLAERRDAHGLKGRFVARGGDQAEDLRFEFCKVGHGDGHLLGARAQPAHEAVIIRESG
jgi:hypothetical protein